MAKQDPLTKQQMRAGHLWFRHLAEDMNSAGLDMKKALKPTTDIWWNDYMVKEYMFRPLMIAKTGKTSTTQLTREEFNQIQEEIIRYLGEKHGLTVPFPSISAIMDEEMLKQRDKECLEEGKKK